MIEVSDTWRSAWRIFQNMYLEARAVRGRSCRPKMGELLGIAELWLGSGHRSTIPTTGMALGDEAERDDEQAIHTLDLLQWCAGRPATRVSGRVSTDGLYECIEVEDTAHIRIEFEGGLVGTFYATVAGSENEPVEIHTRLEGGRLLYRSGWLYRWESDGRLTLLVAPERQAKGDKAYWGIGHRAQLKDYYESVLGVAPIWLDARQGFGALEIIRALYAASRVGQPITLLG